MCLLELYLNSCKPYCISCLHGNCIATNQCECPEGHILTVTGNDCEPNCANCRNGDCVAPNECICHDGYARAPDQDACEPVCTMCNFGQCVSPGKCVCDEGYSYTSEEKGCEPICDPPCVNGECRNPGHCLCHDGFALSIRDGQCHPVCNEACINGYCAGPNKCECNNGYHMQNETFCEPICEDLCPVNSRCVAPYECGCESGYQANHYDNRCEPICDFPCENGFCSAPNKCSCSPVHREVVDNSTGHTKCVECECQNGRCYMNDCICDDGFVKTGPFHCEATCPSECGLGCSVPGVCDQEVSTTDDDYFDTTSPSLNFDYETNFYSVAISTTTTDDDDDDQTKTHEDNLKYSRTLNTEILTISPEIVNCSEADSPGCKKLQTVVEGSSTHEDVQNEPKWYIWLMTGLGVISCLVIVGFVYAKTIRKKSFDLSDSDSRLSVSYHRN